MEPPPSSSDPPADVSGPETYHRRRKPFAAVAIAVVAGAAVVWVRLRLHPTRVAIEGGSMLPTLAPGDWALALTPSSWRRGDVVVVAHPDRPGLEMVKRLAAIPGDEVAGRTLGANEWWVLGDRAAASTDSRQFGPVPGETLRARVVLIYWPPADRRFVR
jgi:nickel-type superoxide dismutase maturation protease